MKPGHGEVIALESGREVGVAMIAFAPLPELKPIRKRLAGKLLDGEPLGIIEESERDTALQALFALAALNSLQIPAPDELRDYFHQSRWSVRREVLEKSDMAVTMLEAYVSHPEAATSSYIGMATIHALRGRKRIHRFFPPRR